MLLDERQDVLLLIVNYEREPERRAVLAAELGQIGHEHGREYEWYAEYIAGTAAAAARHFATAQQVARRWNSPHWTARVRTAARQCPPNG